MSDFSDYYEDEIGDHMLRNQSFTPPTTIYVALFSAATGLEANNPTAELSGDGYARQLVALDAFSGGLSANTADISFPVASAAWATATHFAIVDHETNTNWGTDVNVLMWSALDASKTCGSGEQLKFPAGDLDVAIQ